MAEVTRDGAPVYPKEALLLGSFWILREIELAWATLSDITLNDTDSIAVWSLPVSKTDARAKACTRSWGCLCSSLSPGLCPFHVMKEYIFNIKDYFEKININVQDDMPLFPDLHGRVSRKQGLVQAIEGVLQCTGEPLVDSSGRRRFGGHSMRVSGSRFWASKGLEIFKIQIFARWGSSIVLRYVAHVPIANLTGDVAGEPTGSCDPPRQSVVALLEKHISDAQQQITSLRAEIDRIGQSLNPSFVQNSQSKAWHKVLVAGLPHHPRSLRTYCGWPFGLSSHLLSSCGPRAGVTVCRKCMRGPIESDSDVDSGSSD
jgi:hypothetical protein